MGTLEDILQESGYEKTDINVWETPRLVATELMTVGPQRLYAEDYSDTGKAESTRDRRPLKLIYYESCLNQDDATKREKYLKTYHGRMFLKKRLKSYLTG